MLFFISIFILEEILESGVDTDAGHFTEVLQRDCSKYSSTCTFLTSSLSCMYCTYAMDAVHLHHWEA